MTTIVDTGRHDTTRFHVRGPRFPNYLLVPVAANVILSVLQLDVVRKTVQCDYRGSPPAW